MVKGGVPNKEGAARMLLRDWNNGKIPFYTLPPEIEDAGKNVHLESKILATYSKEFDIDALLEVRSDMGWLEALWCAVVYCAVR